MKIKAVLKNSAIILFVAILNSCGTPPARINFYGENVGVERVKDAEDIIFYSAFCGFYDRNFRYPVLLGNGEFGCDEEWEWGDDKIVMDQHIVGFVCKVEESQRRGGYKFVNFIYGNYDSSPEIFDSWKMLSYNGVRFYLKQERGRLYVSTIKLKISQ